MKKSLLTLAALGTLSSPAFAEPITMDEILVTASRIDAPIAGNDTYILESDDLDALPGESLPDLLKSLPVIQTQDTFGGINGMETTVDMRGFGAAAISNTLILLNGRRLNALDQSNVDWSSIPKDHIERIEVLPGGAGAVLYGEGAVGGAINIITKVGSVGAPTGKAGIAIGSFDTREAQVSTTGGTEKTQTAFFATRVTTDGYRDNNDMEETAFTSDINHRFNEGDLRVTLSGDKKHLGLPGARLVTATSSQLLTDREGATTPYDWTKEEGLSLMTSFSRDVMENSRLTLKGDIKNRKQIYSYYDSWGDTHGNTEMTDLHFSPELKTALSIAGKKSDIQTGLDLSYVTYDSTRSQNMETRPFHQYNARQDAIGAYMMSHTSLSETFDLSLGLRGENTRFYAGDEVDTTAPGGAWETDHDTHADTVSSGNAHIGLDAKLTDNVKIFGSIAKAVRLPTMDERIGGSGGASLALKAQRSMTYEGGSSWDGEKVSLRASVWHMRLRNEIHYDSAVFQNINLDPTKRLGMTLSGTVELPQDLSLSAYVTRTNARFTGGSHKGSEIPLVSDTTAGASLTWNAMDDLSLVTSLTHVGSRRMDNDQNNWQPRIPEQTTLDMKLSGEKGRFFYSAEALNLLNEEYFNYAVASTATAGRYNAYPMPGQSFMLRAGFSF